MLRGLHGDPARIHEEPLHPTDGDQERHRGDVSRAGTEPVGSWAAQADLGAQAAAPLLTPRGHPSPKEKVTRALS